MPLLFAKVCTTSNKWNLIRKGRKASEYNLSPQAHTSSGNPADDYEVFDSNRRVVGRIMLHPQATKDLPWFLDDNGSRNPTISPQSRIFSDPRTGDGGF
jgi:hypothetical protein